MKDNVLPADTFVVFNKTIINEYDRKILTMLYQPIIGANAACLYFTLWAYLDKNNLYSNEWTHHHLMTNMRTRLNDIVESREKLEAIGLIKTYVKKGNVNNYVYEIYSPVSAAEFVSNPILGTTLYNNVGDIEYEKIIEYFKIPKVILKDYEEITCKFSDVFESTNFSNFESIEGDLKRSKSNKLELASKIDLNSIFSLIPEEMLNQRTITKETKELIYKLGFIYNFDEERMTELIRNSLNEKNAIDKNLLRLNAQKFYQFENNGKLPSLIYRNQPEYLRSPVGDNSKKAKIIYQFETTSPYDFLMSKNNGVKPSKNDLTLLEYLLLNVDLKPGVVNVLIDYVLKINNNKLNKAFVEVIASQWARNKVETVPSAMKLAEKEYKSRQIKKYPDKIKEAKPEWFDKDIKETKASDEEIKMMEEMLKEFK
ncbi:MAG: DnaD domain protein [Bacilli bacterium]|nr:DnaD domain protein [Bacilli bacterium]